MSCEYVGLEIRGKIIPIIYVPILDELNISSNELSMNEFLFEYGLKSVCNTTIWKWMKFLGYEYNERKKCYFSDKHEHKENVQYRKEFIKKYFTLEKRAHQWIHITEDEAKRLEQDKDQPLLENVYREFVKD